MEIEIILRGESKVEMPLNYIIDEINRQPLIKRFEVLKRMLNEVILADGDNIPIEHRAIILDFLQRHYEIFSRSLTPPEKSKKKRIFKFF
jgi:hypothetical protein